MLDRGGFREGAGRKSSGKRKVTSYVTEQEEQYIKSFLADIREHVFLKKEILNEGVVYSMSGSLARINGKMKNIEKTKMDKLKTVVLRVDPETRKITKEQKKSIEDKIVKYDLAIEQTTEIIGEVKNIILPSNGLTKSRDEWSQKKKEMEEIKCGIIERREEAKKILSNEGFAPFDEI